jgi:dethiobiotin synthetase
VKLIGVVGTATEIGKTWTTAHVLGACQADGLRVAVRKPVQSFDPDDSAPTDAEVLGDATGEPPESVCPPHRWLPTPMAPPMAADFLRLPRPQVDDLVAETIWPEDAELGFVELVGGVRSPVADAADCVQCLAAYEPDVVLLVADAGLGTIDAVRLALGALDGFAVEVFLNRYDDTADLHRRNRAWLHEVDGVDTHVEISALARTLSAPVN